MYDHRLADRHDRNQNTHQNQSTCHPENSRQEGCAQRRAQDQSDNGKRQGNSSLLGRVLVKLFHRTNNGPVLFQGHEELGYDGHIIKSQDR